MPPGQFGAYAAPYPPPPAAHTVPVEPWFTRTDLRAAAIVVGVLAVVGVGVGILWQAISPHSVGYVQSAQFTIPDEAEGFIAADGRYVLLTGAVGLIAGLAGYLWRSTRGPVMALAVAAGGTLGAWLTALVGGALSSGHDTGKVNTLVTMKVGLHAHSLLAVEGALALIVYLVAVLLAGPDDLGRPPEPQQTAPEPALSGYGPGPAQL